MIRVFVVASTPMMLAGLRTMLTTPDLQVVGETSMPGELPGELPAIDVIVVDELLLEEVRRAMTDNGNVTVALVVLTNNDEGPIPVLRTLS